MPMNRPPTRRRKCPWFRESTPIARTAQTIARIKQNLAVPAASVPGLRLPIYVWL
jgi:hypothetical protein